jgi:hypothetical protein
MNDRERFYLPELLALLPSWSVYEAENWPVCTPASLRRSYLSCPREGGLVVLRGLEAPTW